MRVFIEIGLGIKKWKCLVANSLIKTNYFFFEKKFFKYFFHFKDQIRKQETRFLEPVRVQIGNLGRNGHPSSAPSIQPFPLFPKGDSAPQTDSSARIGLGRRVFPLETVWWAQKPALESAAIY
jgi:hypothetical protein